MNSDSLVIVFDLVNSLIAENIAYYSKTKGVTSIKISGKLEFSKMYLKTILDGNMSIRQRTVVEPRI